MVAFNAQNAVAGQQDFSLHNTTAYTIREVYVSPSERARRGIWEEDVLGIDVLLSGQYTTINFPDYPTNKCSFGIKVVFTDDSSLENIGFNLCELSHIDVP